MKNTSWSNLQRCNEEWRRKDVFWGLMAENSIFICAWKCIGSHYTVWELWEQPASKAFPEKTKRASSCFVVLWKVSIYSSDIALGTMYLSNPFQNLTNPWITLQWLTPEFKTLQNPRVITFANRAFGKIPQHRGNRDFISLASISCSYQGSLLATSSVSLRLKHNKGKRAPSVLSCNTPPP